MLSSLRRRRAAPRLLGLALFCAVMAALALVHHGNPGARDALVAAATGWLPGPLAEVAGVTLARGVLSPGLWLLLGAILCLETVLPAREEQPLFGRGLAADYLWFLCQLSIFALLAGAYGRLLDAGLAALGVGPRYALLPGAPAWLRLAVVAVVVDFLEWAHHRLRHAVPFLWSFHSIHHSQRELNALTDARFHVVEALFVATLMALPTQLFGLSLAEASLYVTARAWYTRLAHANVRLSFGPLRYLLVTPQSHRVHHSIDRAHRDHNYGVVLSVWDRLFGTQHPDHTSYPATGVDVPGFPHETTWRSVLGLGALARQLWEPVRQIGLLRRGGAG